MGISVGGFALLALVFLDCGMLSARAQARANSPTTGQTKIVLGGKEYLNASDFKVVDEKLRIIHGEGISSIPISQITPEEIAALPVEVRLQVSLPQGRTEKTHNTHAGMPRAANTIPLNDLDLKLGDKTINGAVAADVTPEAITVRSRYGSVEVGLYDVNEVELRFLPASLADAVRASMLFPVGNTTLTVKEDKSITGSIQSLSDLLQEQYGIYLSVDPILDFVSSSSAEIPVHLTKGQSLFDAVSNAVSVAPGKATIFPITSNIWFVGAPSALSAERARLAFRRGDMEAFRRWAGKAPGESRLANFFAVENLLNRFDTDVGKPMARLIEIEDEAIKSERIKRGHIRTLGVLFGQLAAAWDMSVRERSAKAADPARIDINDNAERNYRKMLVTHRTQIDSAIRGLNDVAKREKDFSEQAEAIEARLGKLDATFWGLVGEILETGGIGVGSGELRRPLVKKLTEFFGSAARLNGLRKQRLTEIQETRDDYDKYIRDTLETRDQWTVEFKDPLRDGFKGLSLARIEYLKRDFEIVKSLQEMAALLSGDGDEVASREAFLSFEPSSVTRESFEKLVSGRDEWGLDFSLRGRAMLGLARVLGGALQKSELRNWLSDGGENLPTRARACLEETREFIAGRKKLEGMQVGHGAGKEGVARGLVVVSSGDGRAGQGRASDVSVTLMETKPSGRALQELLPKEWNAVADAEVFCSFVAPRERVGIDMLVSIRDAALWVKGQGLRGSSSSGRYAVVNFDETLLSMGRAGDSAGVAFAAALHSAYSRNSGNPRVAVTGAIHPKGEVRPVGGVDKKISGAIDAECDFVIIPTANRGVIYELPIKALLGIQVLEIRDAAEALPFLSMETGDQNYITAIGSAYWSAVNFLREGSAGMAARVLEGLLERVPSHLSARRLREMVGDDVVEGEVPGAVSVLIREGLRRDPKSHSSAAAKASGDDLIAGPRSGGGIGGTSGSEKRVGADRPAAVADALERARGLLSEGNVRAAFLAFEEARKSHNLWDSGGPDQASRLAEFGLEIFGAARKEGDLPLATSALATSLSLTDRNPKVSETIIGVFDDLTKMVKRGEVTAAMEQIRYLEGVGLEKTALVSRYREQLSNELVDAAWDSFLGVRFGTCGAAIEAARSLWPENPRLGWIRTVRGATFFFGVIIGLVIIFKGVEKLYWWMNQS